MATSWQEVQQEVLDLLADWRAKGAPTAWFRGHRKSEWTCKSSLHRYIEECSEIDKRAHEAAIKSYTPLNKKLALLSEYESIYATHRSRAWQLFSDRERSDWGIVFSMQHNGLPTRLLDWTESFACAVYFAQDRRKPDEEAAIYVLNPIAMNQASIGVSKFIGLDENCNEPKEGEIDLRPYHPAYQNPKVDLSSIAVVPFFSNRRMAAQRSAFTIAGDSFLSLEEQFDGELLAKGFIRKIILPSDTYSDAQTFLDLVGMGHYGYFPDMEGLVKEHQDFLFRKFPEMLKARYERRNE